MRYRQILEIKNKKSKSKVNFSELHPISYMIKWDESKLRETAIVATKYDADGKPNAWAIRHAGWCMSKKTGEFDYEARPSERDDKFFKEFRFNTAEEAYKSYLKFNP